MCLHFCGAALVGCVVGSAFAMMMYKVMKKFRIFVNIDTENYT